MIKTTSAYLPVIFVVYWDSANLPRFSLEPSVCTTFLGIGYKNVSDMLFAYITIHSDNDGIVCMYIIDASTDTLSSLERK